MRILQRLIFALLFGTGAVEAQTAPPVPRERFAGARCKIATRGHSKGQRMSRMRRAAFLGILFFGVVACGQRASAQAGYTLKPTPKTVAWGYYDAKAAPVLRIKSGDTVEIQTLITISPKALEAAGVPPEQVEHSLRDIAVTVPSAGTRVPGRTNTTLPTRNCATGIFSMPFSVTTSALSGNSAANALSAPRAWVMAFISSQWPSTMMVMSVANSHHTSTSKKPSVAASDAANATRIARLISVIMPG